MYNYLLRANIRGVVIDAGHGGEDPGAIGNNIIEKDYNLTAAKYISDRLNELGIPNKLTRSTDETLTPTERTNRIKNAFGNYSDVLVISNHLNAGGGNGAETIYALRNTDTFAKNILENIGDAGQEMRKYYQRRLPSNPSKDYYFIHRDTGITQPVIVEYGFVDNVTDAQNLKDNFLNYVEGTVKAIADYADVAYIPPEGSNIYVVKQGDSLWSIANQYGVSVDELISVNNLKTNILNVGQLLTIPAKEQPTPSEFFVYTVKNGDSLWSIANQYGVSVDDIINLNNLSTTLLQTNQQLLIPKKKEEIKATNIYIVKQGDSLWSVANQHGISVNDLTSANSLSNNNLSIGQELFIPITTSENEYIVKSGDSLWAIANQYGITVDDIIKENQLTNNNLSVGQIITIPSKIEDTNSEEVSYIVQSGDSLWSIAKKYNTNVNELKTYNNLTNNSLTIGQKLLIPKTQDYITYYVKEGDNLWDLANTYNTNVNELKSVNNLTSNSLTIGQVLLIPNS